MTDTRKLQRALFRMQADGAFADAVLAREEGALRSTGLDASGIELLTAVDRAALAADPGGKRRTQILGNVASEYTLTLAATSGSAEGARLLDGFLSSEEFHSAMARDERLPIAFGSYLARACEALARSDAAFGVRPLVTLERAMVELRRTADDGSGARLAPGDVRLSSRARLVTLPAGTLDHASALRTAIDAGAALPARAAPNGPDETVLLHALPGRSPHVLPELSVELLSPPADALLALATSSLSRDARAAFAREQGAAPEDLERFLEGFVDEGVLIRSA